MYFFNVFLLLQSPLSLRCFCLVDWQPRSCLSLALLNPPLMLLLLWLSLVHWQPRLNWGLGDAVLDPPLMLLNLMLDLLPPLILLCLVHWQSTSHLNWGLRDAVLDPLSQFFLSLLCLILL